MPYADKDIARTKAKEYRKANKNRDRIKQREWVKKNPDRVRAIKERLAQRNMEWLLTHIGTNKLHCDHCRYDKSFAALQFHHINPNDKESVRDHMAHWLRSMSLERFQNKILTHRFLILCANCHAELHAGLWKYGE